MAKNIIIKPKFDRKKGVRTSKENTGAFYCYLYAKLFGGRVIEKKKGETFTPDIIKETDEEKGYTEVKSIGISTSQTMCEVKQFKNYFDCSITDMLNTNKTIISNYAFFRYIDKKSSGKTADMKTSELKDELCERTKSVLIAPLNLTALILLNSNRMNVKRSAPTTKGVKQNKRDYWRVPGQIIQGLHDCPSETIKALKNGCGYSEYTMQYAFLLSHLNYERYWVDNAYCHKTKIHPLLVTRFFNKNPDLFEEKMKEEYARIEKCMMKIK